jgi:ribosomal protein S18 acetylase RimI-like enzyme
MSERGGMAHAQRIDRVGEFTIRPYRSRDRDAVRRICYLTGYMGESADWMWHDQESFSDIFTGYWTDREAEHALVAEHDGEVVGYLLGCMDSRRVWNVGKVVARHGFVRGVAFRPGTSKMFWRMITDGISDSIHHELPPPGYYDERWPAHLHIDLLPVCRRSGVGSALVGRWLEKLKLAGVPGCHLQTMSENTRAIAFFHKMGFSEVGDPDGAPGFRTRSGERMHVQLMAQAFDSDAEG